MAVKDLAHYLENDVKVYVDVNAHHATDGTITPLSFIWEDGKNYAIDRVISSCRAASTKAGGVGLRYTIRVEGRETFIYLEEEGDVTRWFMERRRARTRKG